METTLEDLYTLQRHYRGKNPLGVIPLLFLHFCDYIPDDEHTAETLCAWLNKKECFYNTAVVFVLFYSLATWNFTFTFVSISEASVGFWGRPVKRFSTHHNNHSCPRWVQGILTLLAAMCWGPHCPGWLQGILTLLAAMCWGPHSRDIKFARHMKRSTNFNPP
jgi:hypothetical protein